MAYILPTSVELMEIAQDLIPRLQQDRAIFDLMPMRDSDRAFVEWDQRDSFTGLQQIRGLGGEPVRVQKLGAKRYRMQPGIYGEFERFDETELTEYRVPGSFDRPIDLRDMVMGSQMRLLERRLDRIEQVGWASLQGQIAVAQMLPGGASTIMYADTFSVQAFTATVPWGTFASATPLADFRNTKLLARGHSVVFDDTARAYTNQSTINKMLSNTNNADLYGRRVTGLATANSLEGVNSLFLADGLPRIIAYDQTYLDDTGAYQLFIPDNTVIIVGRRPGNVPVAEYLFTRNVNNPGFAPGPYMDVVDRLTQGGQYPRTIDIHDGHNGGIALLYPSAVVVMHV